MARQAGGGGMDAMIAVVLVLIVGGLLLQLTMGEPSHERPEETEEDDDGRPWT
jgi:hypothetical protein